VSGTELRAILLSFAYVLAVLLLADLSRRRLHMPVDITRKIVHIAVGMWVLPTLWLFERWSWWVILPPLVFVLLNALSLRFRFFAAIEVAERSLGTVFFPLSFAILLATFWPAGRPEIAAGGVLAMAWGDAMASLVGRAYGRRGYRIWGQTKTWLGSLACFSWATLAVVVALRCVGNSPGPQALWHAALAGLVAAVAEALAPRGFDNLAVPLATGGVLYLLGTAV